MKVRNIFGSEQSRNAVDPEQIAAISVYTSGKTKVVEKQPHLHYLQEGMLAIAAFCTTCQRTVYIGGDDDDGCPVCSTPLVDQDETAWVAPPAPRAPA